MSRHHHKSKAEQIDSRTIDAIQLQQEKMPFQRKVSSGPDYVEKKKILDNNSIQLRAYQIFNEKGGAALDNWLEAEQGLLKG